MESITEIIEKAHHLTKDPENFFSCEDDIASDIKELTKRLYDFKKHETYSKCNVKILEQLILENLDEEQIWQQIELCNNFLYEEFVSDIAQILSKKNNIDISHSEATNNDIINGKEDENGEDEDDAETENENESDVNDRESEREMEKNARKGSTLKKIKPSIVDDKFFKLSEMENFLNLEENKENGGNNNDNDDDDEDNFIDYFDDISDSNHDEEEGPVYEDFFDEPHDEINVRKRENEVNIKDVDDKPSRKKVKFQINSELNESNDDSDEHYDDFPDGTAEDENDFDFEKNCEKKNSNSISSFEARQERLKTRIKALEEEALKEKPWQLKGEVTAGNRPQNSLLEEFVEFDTAVRPPPVITEKTTLRLEDIIKQRIKDKAWDDVERKIKPVEDPKEYKKRLVLDQEKSKVSLAQIYEQEYLKQKKAKSEGTEDKPEEVPKEHIEIDKMMKSLFSKLEALFNFHFTPKMVTTEVKIVSNLPAVTVEEVAPVATSDAALLAPEEIKPKMRGDLIGKTERTKTDKKRERRIKKKKQRIKQKETEKKEKLKKQKSKDFSKNSKTVSKKQLKKLGQNVTLVNESDGGKYVKSSNTFFSKLQDEVRSHIRKKSTDMKKYESKNNLNVKKLKL